MCVFCECMCGVGFGFVVCVVNVWCVRVLVCRDSLCVCVVFV